MKEISILAIHAISTVRIDSVGFKFWPRLKKQRWVPLPGGAELGVKAKMNLTNDKFCHE
jgi:hypothetical protein